MAKVSIIKKVAHLSVKDYLDLESSSDQRHEYVSGAICEMVDGTVRHNLISLSLATLLRAHLKNSTCHVFMSDMKVQIDSIFYYPDIMVVCSPVDPKSLFQTEPTLLIEVLSKSTEAKDRLEKLVAYQSIPSVQEYVLVAQDKVSIDIYRRESNADDEASWVLEYLSYGDVLKLHSINFELPAEAFYEDVIASFRE